MKLIKFFTFHLFRYSIKQSINIQKIVDKNFENRYLSRFLLEVKINVDTLPPYQINYDSWENELFDSMYDRDSFDGTLKRNKMDCKLLNFEQFISEKLTFKEKIHLYQSIIKDLLELAEMLLNSNEN